eukprot:4122376-Amphidinium_carterae.1
MMSVNRRRRLTSTKNNARRKRRTMTSPSTVSSTRLRTLAPSALRSACLPREIDLRVGELSMHRLVWQASIRLSSLCTFPPMRGNLLPRLAGSWVCDPRVGGIELAPPHLAHFNSIVFDMHAPP